MADVIVIGAGMAGVTAARELARAGLSRPGARRARPDRRARPHRARLLRRAGRSRRRVHPRRRRRDLARRARRRLAVRPSPHTRDTMFNIGHGTHWLPRMLLHPGVWPTFTILRASAGSAARPVGARVHRAARLPRPRAHPGRDGAHRASARQHRRGRHARPARGRRARPRIGPEPSRRRRLRPAAAAHRARARRRVRLHRRDGRVVAATASRSRAAMAASARRAPRSARCRSGVLQSGAVRFVPELPESKRQALERIVMGPVLKILLRFEERFWPARWRRSSAASARCAALLGVFYRAADGAAGADRLLHRPPCRGAGSRQRERRRPSCATDLRRHFPEAQPRLVALSPHRLGRRSVGAAAGTRSCVPAAAARAPPGGRRHRRAVLGRLGDGDDYDRRRRGRLRQRRARRGAACAGICAAEPHRESGGAAPDRGQPGGRRFVAAGGRYSRRHPARVALVMGRGGLPGN